MMSHPEPPGAPQSGPVSTPADKPTDRADASAEDQPTQRADALAPVGRSDSVGWSDPVDRSGPASRAGLPGPLEADRRALRQPQRVSPVGPLFLAWAVVRQVGFLNIGIFTAVVGSGNFQTLGLVAAAVLFAAGVARWLRFTYHLEPTDDGDQLVTMAGVFGRTRTSVPLDRVQSVSTRQNLLHRIFNLVEVNVQTAGSAASEVQLPAVGPQVADRLRRLSTATHTSGSIASEPPPPSGPAACIGAHRVPPVPLPFEADPVLHRSLADIFRVAASRNPIVLLAPIPIAFGLFANVDEEWAERATGPVADMVERIGGSVAGVVALVAAVLLVSVVASVGFVVLRLYDLRLFVDGAGLRQLSGLISRTEVTASVERIQVLAVKCNPLERMLRHHEVVLPLAGSPAISAVAGGATRGAASRIPLPGTLADELVRIGDLVFGDERRDEPGHNLGNEISPLAIQRWTLWIGLVPALILAGAAWVSIDGWALAAAVGVATVWVAIVWNGASLRRRSWNWSLGPETLRVRSGVITKLTRTMGVRKAQNISIKQGIFHRRHNLAHLRVRTASQVTMLVPHIPLPLAQALRDELLFRMQSDPRPFM